MSIIRLTINLLICLSLLVSPIYAGDISNLEGAWLLNESSSTRFDESVNSNDLTDNNTVGFNASCQFDGCADFNGTNHYLSITDASQTGLDITGDFSFGFWINPDTVAGTRHFMHKFASNLGYFLRIRIDSKPEVFINATPIGGNGTVLSASVFTHVTIIYDGSTVNFLLNCVSDINPTHTSNPSASTGNFVLGRRDDTSNSHHDGLMDDAFIFSRAILTGECIDIKDNGIEAFLFQRSRIIIIIATVMYGVIGTIISNIQYYNLVNVHRLKFDIDRPKWMQILYKFENPFTIPEVYAAPTQTDTDKANAEFDSRDSYQTVYKSINSVYQQQVPFTKDGIEYETHVYEGPQGIGVIYIARKYENDKIYVRKKHVGPENRQISNDWVEVEDNL